MGKPLFVTRRDLCTWCKGAYPGKWNISVPGGKENNSYFLSSGERKGRSPNL